jgi:hypothetical protein
MTRKTGWGTAQRRGGDDWSDEENEAQVANLMAKVKTAPRKDRQPPLVSFNDRLQAAVVHDGINGGFVNDETLNGGRP